MNIELYLYIYWGKGKHDHGEKEQQESPHLASARKSHYTVRTVPD